MGLEGRLRGPDFERILKRAKYEPEARLDNPAAFETSTGVFLARSPHASELVVSTIGQLGNVKISARDRLMPFTAGKDVLRTLPHIYTNDTVVDNEITYVISSIQYLPPEEYKHPLELLRIDRRSFVDSMTLLCEEQERLYRNDILLEDRSINNIRVQEGFTNPKHIDLNPKRPGEGARGTAGFVPPHLSPASLEASMTELTYSIAQVALQAADFHGLKDLEEVKLVKDYIDEYHRAGSDAKLWIGDLRERLQRPTRLREEKRKARSSLLRKAAFTLALLSGAGYAAQSIMHNRAVYEQSENAALDRLAEVDIADTASVHKLERELGIALSKKIAQLYTPISDGGMLRAPIMDSARMVPGATAKGESFDLGAFVHLPEGNGFTNVLYAAAEVDPKVLPNARAIARSQLRNLLKANALQSGQWNNLAVDGLMLGYADTKDPEYLLGVIKSAAFVASMAELSRGATPKGTPILPALRWANPILEPLLMQHFDMHLVTSTLLPGHDAQGLLRNHPEIVSRLRADTAFSRLLSHDSMSATIKPLIDPLSYDYLSLAQELCLRSYPNMIKHGLVSARAEWKGKWVASEDVRSLGHALLAHASWEVAIRSEGNVSERLKQQSMMLENRLLALDSLPRQFMVTKSATNPTDAATAALAYRVARLQDRPVSQYWPLFSRLVPLIPRATIEGAPRRRIYREEPYLFADGCALSSMQVCDVGTTTSANDLLRGLLR